MSAEHRHHNSNIREGTTDTAQIPPTINANTKRVLLKPSTPLFLTCKISQPLVDALIPRLSQSGCESLYFSELKPRGRSLLEAMMKTRRAWNKNLANLKNQVEAIKQEYNNPNPAPGSTTPKPNENSTITTADMSNRKRDSKPTKSSLATPKAAGTRCQQTHRRLRKKEVTFNSRSPTVRPYDQHANANQRDRNSSEVEDRQWTGTKHASILGEAQKNSMPQQTQRPSLKLKLSTSNFQKSPSSQPTPTGGAQTPNPQSAVRTPSIKLNFAKKPSISSAASPVIKNDKSEAGPSSAKKRKRAKADDGSEDELAKPPPQRRLTLKTSAASAKTPITPGPIFKLKTKGKVPKRPLGVGYDSELEEREIDPVILEGLILRMPPGPDCDYIQAAIRDGTIGGHRAQGGADIRIRCLDTTGRRGVLFANGHQYATTVVDLPCIIEGMKSWDKKGWIKSIDICQMMLVLGPCKSDEEAKNYPLPNDVDPKTFAYAHGLTAPMKWVRKRRFARTRRARVDDIESIERKVNALLEADAKAMSSKFQIFDHDPRIEEQFSEVEDDYDDDDDAEGELEDGYFPRQTSTMGATPIGMELDAHVDQDQIDDIEAMFNEDEDDISAPNLNGHVLSKTIVKALLPPGARDSSVAVTSASASPSASVAVTAVATPAGDGQGASSDDDEDDDEDASDRSDSEKDADDNLQQVKDRIADMESKIREQTELLKKTPNAILKKKLARKIGELRDDVRMMKVQNGLAAEGDEDDGDE